jgi:hypothetical protein
VPFFSAIVSGTPRNAFTAAAGQPQSSRHILPRFSNSTMFVQKLVDLRKLFV